MDLAGKGVPGDALYAHRELSRDIVAAGGDYLWALKANQPNARAEVALLFQEPPWGEPFPESGQENRHGGRWEQRWLWPATALQGSRDWPEGQPVCGLERTRCFRGKTTVELAYAITRLPPEQAGPERLLQLWRGPWGIENRGPWAPEVPLGEDRSAGRSGAAPPGMAALRNLVLGLLRLAGQRNIAAALRHYGWPSAAALQLLGFPFPDN